MALIPSKSKVSTFSTDSFSFGTMMIILCVVMIGSHIVDEYVHSNFSIPAILFLVSIVVYLLYPNKSYYGKNGAQRIMICIKYYLRQMRRYIN